MSFASKYNTHKPLFSIDTSGFKYVSLADLFGKFGVKRVYPLKALFIHNKSNYGPQVLAATDKFYVNFPSYLLDTAQQILEDPDAVQDINDGAVGFKIYTYVASKHNNKACYGVEFVDIEPQEAE